MVRVAVMNVVDLVLRFALKPFNKGIGSYSGYLYEFQTGKCDYQAGAIERFGENVWKLAGT